MLLASAASAGSGSGMLCGEDPAFLCGSRNCCAISGPSSSSNDSYRCRAWCNSALKCSCCWRLDTAVSCVGRSFSSACNLCGARHVTPLMRPTHVAWRRRAARGHGYGLSSSCAKTYDLWSRAILTDRAFTSCILRAVFDSCTAALQAASPVL